jgi:hypothetical protein
MFPSSSSKYLSASLSDCGSTDPESPAVATSPATPPRGSLRGVAAAAAAGSWIPEAALAQGALASCEAAYPSGELESSLVVESGAHFIVAVLEGEEEEEEEENEDFAEAALTLLLPALLLLLLPLLLLPARSFSEGAGGAAAAAAAAAAATFLAGGALSTEAVSISSWFL